MRFVVSEDPARGDESLTLFAYESDHPMGLVLAKPSERGLHVQSVIVREPFRRKGVATALLKRLEAEARSRGVRTLHATLSSEDAETPAALHLLARAGYREPLAGMLICQCTDDGIRMAPWLRRNPPADVRITSWGELTEIQLRDVTSFHSPVPESFTPASQASIDPEVSTAAQVGGRVVGWMLCRRTAPDRIQYGRFFLEPERRKSGVALAMLAEAIRRQVHLRIHWGDFAVRLDNRGMLAFVRRYLENFCTSQYVLRDLVKALE